MVRTIIISFMFTRDSACARCCCHKIQFGGRGGGCSYYLNVEKRGAVGRQLSDSEQTSRPLSTASPRSHTDGRWRARTDCCAVAARAVSRAPYSMARPSPSPPRPTDRPAANERAPSAAGRPAGLPPRAPSLPIHHSSTCQLAAAPAWQTVAVPGGLIGSSAALPDPHSLSLGPGRAAVQP